MKRAGIILCFNFFLLFIGFSGTLHAEKPIWKIGRRDNDYRGFSWPQTQIIDYLVPINWETLLTESNPDWGGFPRHLYTSLANEQNEDIKGLQEIHINFTYSADYNNPTFLIRAETSSFDPNACFVLEIMKCNKKIHLDLRRMDNDSFEDYTFPVGFITSGDINKKNEIIIRCDGPPGGYIVFDYLELYYDDADSDQDGICDSDEGNEAASDSRTVCISKVGRDPDVKKIYTLTIQEPAGDIPYFRDVRLNDPNDPVVSERLKSSYYFPYGFLGFQIAEIEEGEHVAIHISYCDTHDPVNAFSPTLCCFAYQDANTWQKVDFSFVDGNTIALSIQDGGNGDSDEGKDGSIDVILALSYTQELDVRSVDKRGCFLRCLAWRE